MRYKHGEESIFVFFLCIVTKRNVVQFSVPTFRECVVRYLMQRLCLPLCGLLFVALHPCRFRVFTVPEAATSMFSNGISFQDLGSEQNRFAFQWSILS